MKIGDQVVLNRTHLMFGLTKDMVGKIKDTPENEQKGNFSLWVDFIYPNKHRDFWNISVEHLSLFCERVEDLIDVDPKDIPPILRDHPEWTSEIIGR